jgi:fused signal recognition particle receptor
VKTTLKIIAELKNVLPKRNISVPKSLNEILQEIASLLSENNSGEATEFVVVPIQTKPLPLMVVGVNEWANNNRGN